MDEKKQKNFKERSIPRFLKGVVLLVFLFFAFEGVRVFREKNAENAVHVQEVKKPFSDIKRSSPKLTIVFIADSFGKRVIENSLPFYEGGIKNFPRFGDPICKCSSSSWKSRYSSRICINDYRNLSLLSWNCE